MPFVFLLKWLLLYKAISNTNFKAPFVALLLALKRLSIKIADAIVINVSLSKRTPICNYSGQERWERLTSELSSNFLSTSKSKEERFVFPFH